MTNDCLIDIGENLNFGASLDFPSLFISCIRNVTWMLNALPTGLRCVVCSICPCCLADLSLGTGCPLQPRAEGAAQSPASENRNIMIQAAYGTRVFLRSGFTHSPDTQRCVRWQAFVWCNGSVLLWLVCVREKRMLGGDVVWSTVCVCQWKQKFVCNKGLPFSQNMHGPEGFHLFFQFSVVIFQFSNTSSSR